MDLKLNHYSLWGCFFILVFLYGFRIYSAFKDGNKQIADILENTDEILVPVKVLGEFYSR